jgi:hypothetical protein
MIVHRPKSRRLRHRPDAENALVMRRSRDEDIQSPTLIVGRSVTDHGNRHAWNLLWAAPARR